MASDLLLALVVGAALTFDFTNGFHDTANVVSTSISTRALSPRLAILIAAILNFVGAFLSLKVAATIASGIVDANLITLQVVFAGLVGAILWNLLTWWFGLPSSSSHALIGGVVGAMLAASGPDAIDIDGLVGKVIVPAFVAPILAFAVAGFGILCIYKIVGRLRPGPVTRGFRLGQIASGSLLALAHGTNDAQKTMGIITLALVAHGSLPAENPTVPTWVVICSATAIALGTYSGGWRIIRTMGSKIIKMDPAQGFASQGSGAAVILAATHVGFPLSTTHVISGGIVGAGAAKRLSAVRWGVAGNMAIAWALTLPAAGLTGALAFEISDLSGGGTVGPVVVCAVLLVAIALFMWLRTPPPLALEPIAITTDRATDAGADRDDAAPESETVGSGGKRS
jgi:PiT family inorganic phosphate transporter